MKGQMSGILYLLRAIPAIEAHTYAITSGVPIQAKNSLASSLLAFNISITAETAIRSWQNVVDLQAVWMTLNVRRIGNFLHRLGLQIIYASLATEPNNHLRRWFTNFSNVSGGSVLQRLVGSKPIEYGGNCL